MQKHLLIIDPLEKLNRELDSSLRLGFELTKLGHEVYAVEPWQLSWDSKTSGPQAKAYRLQYSDKAESARDSKRDYAPLSDFAGIHMRKDPPFDIDYIMTTWFLEAVPATTKVFNEPAGLRAVNEKLATLAYREFSLPSLVSCQAEELLDYIIDVCENDAVIKPLTLYGGKGIERIQLDGSANGKKQVLNALIRLTDGEKSFRLCQKFNPRVFDGEVRAFAIGGKALAWCLKKPTNGQFLANSNFGSTRHVYKPTEDEVIAVNAVARDLHENHGISIVGFDLIGGKISEVNVTSPRLLQASEDRTNYYESFAKWIAETCS